MSTYTRRSYLAGMLGAVWLMGQLPANAQNQTKHEKADPLIGAWSLDATRSTFTPGPAPGGRTMTFEAVDNGFKHITKTTGGFLDDQSDYTVHFDGKDYSADPSAPVGTYSVKRVDANTIERTGKIGSMPVETTIFKVSPDGKTLTMTVTGSIRGDDYSSTQVYTRL